MAHSHLVRQLQISITSFLIIGLAACSQPSNTSDSQPSSAAEASPTAEPTAAPTETSQNGDLTELFSHIWLVSDDSSQPPSSSIYIFLPNGTVLETSCTETYRIATWTVDKDAPDVLKVVEDGELAFTATIAELSSTTLQLQKSLVRSNETQDVTLSAVEQEFVCPDLPR
ncbi:MAG: hypothetical protein WA947_15405 [Phormidesmis sp.]